MITFTPKPGTQLTFLDPRLGAMRSAHSPTASSSLLQRIHVLRSLPEPFDKAALTTQSTARPSAKINGYVGSLTILPSDLSVARARHWHDQSAGTGKAIYRLVPWSGSDD